MLQVRHAEPGDADACARAHIDAWRAAYRGVIPDDYLDDPEFEAERMRMWQAWAWPQMTGAALFVPELDGHVVGFGLIGPERPQEGATGTHCGEVYAFYMHPTVWGSSAAAATMAHCTDHFRAHGFFDAVLWVLRDNPRARHFYEKVGWSATGRSMSWDGPVSGRSLPEPVIEVQYAVDLR